MDEERCGRCCVREGLFCGRKDDADPLESGVMKAVDEYIRVEGGAIMLRRILSGVIEDLWMVRALCASLRENGNPFDLKKNQIISNFFEGNVFQS